MPSNALNLKLYPLARLKVGQAVLLGPYNAANTAANKIVHLRQSDPDAFRTWKFVQQQMLLINPLTCETVKMYLMTRIA
jgi:hypothetical protein